MKKLIIILFLLFSNSLNAQENILLPLSKVVEQENVTQNLEKWTHEINYINSKIKNKNITIKELKIHKKSVSKIKNKTKNTEKTINRLLQTSKLELDALGEKPKEGEKKEPLFKEQKRKIINKEYNKLKEKHAQFILISSQINDLSNQISNIMHKWILENILIKDKSPTNPKIIANFIPEFFNIIDKTISITVKWWQEKNINSEKEAFKGSLWVLLLEILFATSFGVFIKNSFIKKYNINKINNQPTYNKKVALFFLNIITKGITPFLIYIVVYHWVIDQSDFLSNIITSTILKLLTILFLIITARLINKSALTPFSPSWSIANLDKNKSKKLKRYINSIILTLGILAFSTQIISITNSSREFLSVFLTIIIITLSGFISKIINDKFWIKETIIDKKDDLDDDDEFSYPAICLIGFCVCLSAILASLFGYPVLGIFLITRMLFTAFIITSAVFLREILLQSIKVVFVKRAIRKALKLKIKTLKKIRFILSLAITPITAIASLFIILPFWGVPKDDLLYWANKLITGFSVGGIHISVLDIFLSIFAFSAVFIASGILKRNVTNKILAETSLDESVKQSLGSGVGYIGVIVALMIAIAVLGVDLSSIAMLAGALSVGIGFGLQNIVNNFVSGIIILIERPIKVGDWVVVNGEEGLVKQVNIRATELETWQKASVIIPNAEILSSFVTNLTHKDRYGRIEIPIGIAYGADVEKTKSILLDCAKKNKKISNNPTPVVHFTNFGDSSLDFELRCFTSNVMERRAVASDLRFEIERKFKEENIEIPFPQRVIHIQK